MQFHGFMRDFEAFCGDFLAVSDHLANDNIITGPGNFYGVGVTDALGLTNRGGIVRVGCVHYNTFGEMDMLFESLERLA